MRWIYFKLIIIIFVVFQIFNYLFLSNYLPNFSILHLKTNVNDNLSICDIKTQLFLTKKSLEINYKNYCPFYDGINDIPISNFSVQLNTNLFQNYINFNLSSESHKNHIKLCASFCRNLAISYFLIFNNTCFCVESYDISINSADSYKNFKWITLYETKAVPINYGKFKTTSKNKNQVVIVFLLMISGRDVLQLYQQFKSIYKPTNYYFIHIDKRHAFLRSYAIRLRDKYSNVVVFDWSMPTIWGGASLLIAYFKAMQDITSKKLKWDFLINLSESDYPIRSIDELQTFLRANINKNFVKSSGQSTIAFIRKQGLNKAFIECNEHLYLVGDRYLPTNLIVDGGSDWFGLSFEFVSYLVTTKDNLIPNLLAFFENSLLPAETFFHMALQNSKFCTSVINTNLRYTNWNRERGCRCQHSSVVGWCGCSPSVLRSYNYNMLRYIVTQDRSIFFARKFDFSIDKSIIYKLDNKSYPLSSCTNFHSHMLNFYSGNQKGDVYQSLAYSLYARLMSQFQFKIKCFPKSLFTSGIDLFLGINQNNSIIITKDVIIKYHHDSFGFEAVYTYSGKAGTIKQYESSSSKTQSNFEIVSFMVGQDYDTKENLFRTLPFLMVPNKTLSLEIQISSLKKLKLIFYILFIDPDKNKYSFKLPKSTTTISSDNQWFDGSTRTFLWYHGFDIQMPYRIGLWQVILYMNEFRKPSIKTFFYIHSQNQSFFDNASDRLNQWKLKSFCIYPNSQCNDNSVYFCNVSCTLDSLFDVNLTD